MAGIEELLERLVTDRKFRTELERDPKAALAGYELSDDDRELLAAQLSADAGKAGTVEQRTSKSALLAALSAFEGVGEAGPGEAADAPARGGVEEISDAGESSQAPVSHVENEAIQINFGDNDLAPPEGAEGFAAAEAPDEPAADFYLKLEGVEGEAADSDSGTAIGDAPEIGATDESSEDGVARYNLVNAWPTKHHEEGVEDLAAPGPEDEPAADMFLKVEGVKGEAQADTGSVADPGSEPPPANQTDHEFLSSRASRSAGSATPDPAPDSSDDFATPEQEPEEGLLLPAVQKVREAAGSDAGDLADAPGPAADSTTAWPSKLEIGSLKAGDTGALDEAAETDMTAPPDEPSDAGPSPGQRGGDG